jgi:hypothetical protein
MASAAQIIANRTNAQHSTGPVTPDGKARTAQNALRHGLTAKHLVIRDDEREEFAQFQQDLIAELAPQGATETITFHELLHAAWNLQRFRRIEAELSTGLSADFTSTDNTAALDRLTRYQARAQRAYYRALDALRTLQTNRALRAVKLEDAEDPKIPVITDINELTKQTHSEVEAEAMKRALQILDLETAAFMRKARRKQPASIEEMTYDPAR